MAFNSANDFLALLRLNGTNTELGRMPPMDLVMQMLADAGLITTVFADAAPVVNMETTAWFDPANPSYGAQGQLRLWDGTTYVAATPALFGTMMAKAAGLAESELLSGAGVPTGALGNDGDFYVRSDAPGGLYGPKAAGAWPAAPLPGGTDSVLSGTGVPAAGVGSDGDIYFRDDAPGGTYLKTAGAWALLVGTGETDSILSGSGVPAAGIGIDEDLYLRTDTPGGVYLKQAGTWALIPGTSSGVGSGVLTGTGVPGAALGVDGDVYTRTDAPGGTYFKAAGTWALAAIPAPAAATDTVAGSVRNATAAEALAGILDGAVNMSPLDVANMHNSDPFSLAINGYAQLPSGVIIQWGYDLAGGNAAILFPVAFPNGSVSIAASVAAILPDNELFSVSFASATGTGFTMNPRYLSGGVVSLANSPVRWIAIGN